MEASVRFETTSGALETYRGLRRLARWGACETWIDSKGVLRVYGADDIGGRELAALWIAPEHGYEEAAGLHVGIGGEPLAPDAYAGLGPEAAAKAIWGRIEAIRCADDGRDA